LTPMSPVQPVNVFDLSKLNAKIRRMKLINVKNQATIYRFDYFVARFKPKMLRLLLFLQHNAL